MSAWLTPQQAAAMVEVSTTAGASAAWAADVEAACEWVEGKRKDLFVGDPVVFTPGPSVKLGTAMFANRLYARRKSPLGTSQNVEFGGSDFLRQDPDIVKLLGISTEGKFTFGAPTIPVVDEVVIP
jgi:hypothetical protein